MTGLADALYLQSWLLQPDATVCTAVATICLDHRNHQYVHAKDVLEVLLLHCSLRRDYMKSVPLEPQGKQSRGLGLAATGLDLAWFNCLQVVSNYEYGSCIQGIAAKLGSPIRNQRLADIVAHRPQASVRSLKWLLGILDNILKQVGASQRKASKMSIPDQTFGGFQRKYGELMASEYMASLVNTVAKYRLVRLNTCDK